ncbi:MAG: prepilin-type N-terminal cleavage/methylation domain-containing protein, partial [Isosphaeraceae bacterium]|nr:prepilin-type N-terminal cleavage/methylation domain-containing protein [Isosphaeraceae bacterium]
MSRPYRRRPGFTLIEMMVVIVIIGILVALLVPVVIGAVRTARNAQVSAEIVNMAQALNAFKDKYGDFPPSRIILSESLAFSQYNTLDPSNSTALSSVSNWYGTTPPNITANDITLGELAQRSARFLRKFFPQAQPPAPTAQVPYWYDFNGNASTNGSSGPDPGLIYLQGDECLVFFLGGIPNPEGISAARTGFGTSGFGKSPQFPFSCPGVTTTSNNRLFSSNRNNPFYEFQSSRLYDPDGDGIPGYIDTLNPNPGGDARFFAYFSAYGNNNYDPNDVNNPNPAAIEQDNTGGPLVQAFRVGYVVTGGTNT